MEQASLYGQRNTQAVNHRPIIDLWWADCGREQTRHEQPVQETYLLARILPEARANGSRNVLVDSHQIVPGARGQQLEEWTDELDSLLANSRDQEIDEVAFQRTTGGLIGPPDYGADVQARYEEFREQLFGEARRLLQNDSPEAIDVALDHWRRRMQSIGRRRGNEMEKQVLDIFSYEARASLHRCYSHVWRSLIAALHRQYSLTEPSVLFHWFWHLDPFTPSNLDEASSANLFHGHIFGLHPACGFVLRTPVGGEIFAQWLRDPMNRRHYCRVLHALAVAVGYYAQKYEITRELRRGRSVIQSFDDMTMVEEQQAAVSSRRRPRRRPIE